MKLVQKNKMDFEWIFICFHNSHSKQKVKQVVHFDLFNSLNYTKKNHFRTFIEKFDFSYNEMLNRLIPSEKACCQIKFRYQSKVCAHTEN